MGVQKSEHYWNCHNHKYPHQVMVGQFSKYDIDPKVAQQKISFHFLRVPFNGVAHWGFEQEYELDRFKRLVGLK